MRTNTLIGSVALTLAAGVLAGCGSGGGSDSSSGDYCSELKADQTYFGALGGSNPDLSNLDELFSRMHTLADDAPDDVADDWKTLDTALTSIEDALKEAGLSTSDLTALENGGAPPAGADLAKLQALAPKLQALSSSDISDAADRIATNAKDACGVDLNAS